MMVLTNLSLSECRETPGTFANVLTFTDVIQVWSDGRQVAGLVLPTCPAPTGHAAYADGGEIHPVGSIAPSAMIQAY